MLSLLVIFLAAISEGEFKSCIDCSEPLRQENVLRAQEIYGYDMVIQGDQDKETAGAWIYWPPVVDDRGVCIRNVAGINGKVEKDGGVIWESVNKEELKERTEQVIWIPPEATKKDCNKINLEAGILDKTSIDIDTLINLNKKIPELLSNAKHYPDVSVDIRVPKDAGGYRINLIEAKEGNSYRLHIGNIDKDNSRSFLMTVKIVDDDEYWVVYLDEFIY